MSIIVEDCFIGFFQSKMSCTLSKILSCVHLHILSVCMNNRCIMFWVLLLLYRKIKALKNQKYSFWNSTKIYSALKYIQHWKVEGTAFAKNRLKNENTVCNNGENKRIGDLNCKQIVVIFSEVDVNSSLNWSIFHLLQ